MFDEGLIHMEVREKRSLTVNVVHLHTKSSVSSFAYFVNCVNSINF